MTGLDLGGIHTRYEGVLKILKQRKCSLAKAMEKYGGARNMLREFIGICELKILDRDKWTGKIKFTISLILSVMPYSDRPGSRRNSHPL